MYSIFLKFIFKILSHFQGRRQKRQDWIEGQKMVWDLIGQGNPQGKPCIWFHAASVGEFEQGRPLIERIRREYPNYFVVLSFFSPSGYNHLKHYPSADLVCYLPLDTFENAEKFLSTINPSLAVFIKYEFWPNFLNQLKEKKIPIILISAIFRKKQIFFQWYGGYFRRVLKNFDKIYLQNKESRELLKTIGIHSSEVVGDTRFDRVLENSKTLVDWEIKKKFVGRKPFIVCGSVWPEDMEVLLPLINHEKLNYRWILVPHEIKREKIEIWTKQIKKSMVYSSQGLGAINQASVLIVDEMGKLSGLYKKASFAYIGGGFKDGLHNTLEAAVFGTPLFFGNKNFEKFEEAKNLIILEIAKPVGSFEEILEKILHLEINQKEREMIEEKSLDYILASKGATEKIFNYIKKKNL